jgi:hypothetical protein
MIKINLRHYYPHYTTKSLSRSEKTVRFSISKCYSQKRAEGNVPDIAMGNFPKMEKTRKQYCFGVFWRSRGDSSGYPAAARSHRSQPGRLPSAVAKNADTAAFLIRGFESL